VARAAALAGHVAAHRRLDKSHDLAAALSHVETRQARNDYTPRGNARWRRKRDWLEDFDLKKAPTIWQAAQASGARRAESR
jgi:hypothetical protein